MARRVSLLSVLAGMAFVLGAPGVAAGGGCHQEPGLELTSSDKSRVAIAGCAFVDTVTYVDPGEKVTWTNEDPVPHSVTGAAMSWGDEYYVNDGDKVSYRFDEPGVYPYYCVLHPSMVGAVVVGDGMSAAALTKGKAAVEDVDVDAGLAAAADDDTPAPPESGGSSEVMIALAVAAGLGAILFTTRTVLRRRTASAPAP